MRVSAIATATSPVRSLGLHPVLVLAHELHETISKQKKRIAQLEAKLQVVRQIAEAQDILAVQHCIAEEKADDIIREQAMQKRLTVEEIARSIINAKEFPGIKKQRVQAVSSSTASTPQQHTGDFLYFF